MRKKFSKIKFYLKKQLVQYIQIRTIGMLIFYYSNTNIKHLNQIFHNSIKNAINEESDFTLVSKATFDSQTQ